MYVYRCFDADDRLMYVGLTLDRAHRYRTHRSGTPWWPDVTRITSTRYDDDEEARRVEASTIARCSPRHNVVHNGGLSTGITVDGVEYITEREAADLAGICVEAIRQRIHRGRLNVALRIGKTPLLLRSDVEAWTDRRLKGEDA